MQCGQFLAIGLFVGFTPIAVGIVGDKGGAVSVDALPGGGEVAGAGEGGMQLRGIRGGGGEAGLAADVVQRQGAEQGLMAAVGAGAIHQMAGAEALLRGGKLPALAVVVSVLQWVVV